MPKLPSTNVPRLVGNPGRLLPLSWWLWAPDSTMPHLLFLFHLLSLPPNSQSLCFGPDQLQYHATFEVKTNPALLRLCNVTVPPEKHIVNVVKIIIKMMRRMTWVSIHEWPKSNVKSGVLLFFLEGGGDLYNVDNGSTEKPSCQRTILHMLEACKDS